MPPSQPPAIAQAKELSQRAQAAYSAKDVSEMVRLHEAAIALCLREVSAQEAAHADSETVDELLHLAKVSAFNLGANTWPGWNEPGIEIKAPHLQAGKRAAQRNLELAQRLKRGPEKLSIAHWLIGAHAMAEGAWDEARRSFELSKQFGEQSGVADQVELARGYLFLMDALQGDPAGQAGLDSTIKHFEAQSKTDPSATIYASQLRSSFAVFKQQPGAERKPL